MATRKISKKIVENKNVVRLSDAVDKHVYETWISMLKALVPGGRTHRLSVLVASMLQYVSCQSGKKAAAVNDLMQEAFDDGEAGPNSPLTKLVQDLFKDAKVKSKRISSRGSGYSIAEEAIDVFMHWDNMPWER